MNELKKILRYPLRFNLRESYILVDFGITLGYDFFVRQYEGNRQLSLNSKPYNLLYQFEINERFAAIKPDMITSLMRYPRINTPGIIKILK